MKTPLERPPANPPDEAADMGTARDVLLAPARAWDRFWFTPADPTTLGLIRVFCGLMVLYVHLSYSWGLLSYVGPEGWLDAEMADWVRLQAPQYAPDWGWDGGYQQYSQGNYYWSIYYHVKDRHWIVAIHVALLGVMALFTVGLWTRVTSVLTWMAAMSYVQRAQTTVFGMDTMMMILLLYLMIGPSGAALSLDRWLAARRDRRAGRPERPPAPSVLANFAVRLIQVHFAVVYLASGTSKLLGTTWWSFTAPNLVLLNPGFGPMYLAPYRELLTFLISHRWLWEALCAGGVLFTIALECGLPLLIWFPRLRWACVCGSVLLHTMIGVTMGLVSFSLMMLVMVLAFVPPEVARQAVDRLRDRLGRGRAGAPGLRAASARPELALART